MYIVYAKKCSEIHLVEEKVCRQCNLHVSVVLSSIEIIIAQQNNLYSYFFPKESLGVSHLIDCLKTQYLGLHVIPFLDCCFLRLNFDNVPYFLEFIQLFF